MNKKSAYVMNWRNRTKMKLVEYKGSKCMECGYDKPIPAAYDFHHRSPDEKDFGIGGKSWSYERLLKEVDKCDLLCVRCHKELHWNLNQVSREERMKIKRKLVQERACRGCGNLFKPTSNKVYNCSNSCRGKSLRKVDRPSKEVLQSEINSMTWIAIGEKYGVSDNAVRKWAKNYGLL